MSHQRNPAALLASRLLSTLVGCLALTTISCSETSPDTAKAGVDAATKTIASVPLWGDVPHGRPSCIKGIHMTAWTTGSKKIRVRFEELFADTELNTAVIDVKEIDDVYIPGVELDGKPVYTAAMKDIREYVQFLKDRGVYTVARLVVFHDTKLVKLKPDWAVHSSVPLPKAVEKGFRNDVWVDRKGSAWADPHNTKVWDYNIMIAEKAADLGFQEIQFDYIRFPSDGNVKAALYSKPHSQDAAVQSLQGFLSKARERLHKKGVTVSIDVFGLVGSTGDGMGIGQRLKDLLAHVDIISPMMYPSHYYPGEYGLKSPENSPYETIHRSIRDTRKMMGSHKVELRPWLQDFSIKVKYTPKMVRDQIEAAEDQGIGEWLLWNPACRYTKEALLRQGGNQVAAGVDSEAEESGE